MTHSFFSYKKNCFYIEEHGETFVDNIFENEGKSPGLTLLHPISNNIDYIEEAIALNHEANHYIQDLSITACIVHGASLDYLSSFCNKLSQCPDIKFPLFEKENFKYNHNLNLSKGYAKTLKAIDELHWVYSFIFLQKHNKPSSEDYLYNSIHEHFFEENELSIDYILETYAYHKAYWDIYAYSNTESESILHELVKKDKVYPIFSHKDGYLINDFRDIKWNKPYQLITFLFLVGLNDSNNKVYLDYCHNEIPKDYKKSVAIQIHATYKLILETALNIPSINLILKEVYCNHQKIEHFSPVHRLYLIIKAIRDSNGYPNAVEGEDFFRTFHNWVAEKYGWPSFDDTLHSVTNYLGIRAQQSQEVITNYQSKALLYKYKHFGLFSQSVPIEIMSSLQIPLIINNSRGLLFEQILGNAIFPFAHLINIYHSYFGKVEKYIPNDNIESMTDKLYNITNNNIGALREIVNRLFSSAAINKYMYNGTFKCPFCQYECHRATPICESFNDFNNVLKNCEKKIFRMGKDLHYYMQNGGGNVEDCMFYNYLLGNNYNI